MNKISPLDLKQMITGDDEFALIDVREQGSYSQAHLLFAICVPLSRLELLIADLVPHTDTHIVVVDDPQSDDFGERACRRLGELGYTTVSLLEDGIAGWQAAGQELFSGINVPSKAFGEFVEHTYDTPRLEAEKVKAMLDDGTNMVIVDSRPYPEYHRMNIPNATDMPGAELAYRIHDIAPDPETLVVVNCAGRTRSIIGAQSLINAGIPNRVVALKDGTMGWHLAGFELEHGSTRQAAPPSDEGLAKGLEAAARVAERFSVPVVDRETVNVWLDDSSRTTYTLDVRSPDEYAEGHLSGYRNAPGGQLVQATDEYMAVRNARVVLADDVGVRATMTASWLIQMGWREVYVLEGGIGSETLEQGEYQTRVLGDPAPATLSSVELLDNLDDYSVLDLGPSPEYERGHIPGARWTVRARLAAALSACPAGEPVVLTSPDGMLARLALSDAQALTDSGVYALEGGTAGWLQAGHAIETGLVHIAGPTDDVWYKPYEHRDAQEKFMRDYLTWEVALVEQIERDGTATFHAF